MSTFKAPKYIYRILYRLRSRGFEAYLVGGCVRDILLGVRPNDYDICTSALPSQVLELFPSARPTGMKHGTVTVYVGKAFAEVTTFRSESSYSDHRHPDSVSFVGDLTTDLSRRDFTINAIALSADGFIIDPFGGREDIAAQRIRCVGVPARRFEEDALRMLRALRFSSRLGFAIDGATLDAMAEKAPLAAGLAAERVHDEVEKILLTHRPEEVFTALSLGLLDAYIQKRPEDAETFSSLAALPRKALERWAGLCLILSREGCIPGADPFLAALRSDSRTLRCCRDCAEILNSPAPGSAYQWKKLLSRFGVDTVSCAAACSDALYKTNCGSALKKVLKSGECFSMRHLAVGGDDLAALGYRGKELGDMLCFLLDYVMEYPENNQAALLLELARRGEEV